MSETPFIIALLALIYAMVMFLLPFFVMRIRRDIISINKKMTRIEELLARLSDRQPQASVSTPRSEERGRRIRACENCGRQVALQDVKCAGCGELLP